MLLDREMPGMITADSSSVLVPSARLSSLLPTSPGNHPTRSHKSTVAFLTAPERNSQQFRPEERGLWLIHLLLSCANAVANNNIECANRYLEQLSGLASLTGDPMQRVATYFMEGLAARVTKAWPGVYRALQCTKFPSEHELLATHKAFFNACPFLKFAFLTVNQVILDAMESEKVVHVVDLDSCEVVQWLALLQAFSCRQGGPPHLRITAVSKRRDIVFPMARILSEEAERLDIPFQFHHVQDSLKTLDVNKLGIKTGEAVAVSSVMKLHTLLAQEDLSSNCSNRLQRVSSSQIATESISRKGASTGDDCEWSSKHNYSHIRGSKRCRNEFDDDDDASEVRSVHDLAMPGNYDVSSSYEFHAPCADLSLSREFDAKKSTSKTLRNTENSAHALFASTEDNPEADQVLDYSSEETAMDRVLCIFRDLSPKAMVLVEQDSSHNGSTLAERFVEALYYYSAMFDSIDRTLPHNSHDRTTIEKHLFGEQIKNIIACESLERMERHEKLETWRTRMERARFVPLFLNISTISQAEKLLRSFASDGYRLVDDRGCLTLCWYGTPLLSSSAWQT